MIKRQSSGCRQDNRGVDAFVVRQSVGSFETIPLDATTVNGEANSTQVNLQPDGSADCVTVVSMSGDNALGLRDSLRSVKPGQMATVFQAIVRSISSNATLTDYTFSPPNNRDTPVQMTVSYHAPLYALVAGSLLIPTNASTDTGAFAAEMRRYPLYQSANSQLVRDTKIVIPTGYHVLVQPADVHQQTALG